MLNSHIRQYICKNTKNIQKSDYMDGFCWQGELDLTLFYKIEGYFDNLKSLMTLMTMTGNDRFSKIQSHKPSFSSKSVKMQQLISKISL